MIPGGLFDFTHGHSADPWDNKGGKQQQERKQKMKRENMWNLRDIVFGVERGMINMARACIVAGIASLIAMSIDMDLFAVIAASATVTAVVCVVFGIMSWRVGEWLEDICFELEFGDPAQTLDLSDWADAQMSKWYIVSLSISAIAIATAISVSSWFLVIMLIPAFWLLGIKLVKRAAEIKISDIGTSEVEIELWRPVFEGARRDEGIDW